MFRQAYYKLAMLALTILLTASLGGMLYLLATQAATLQIVKEAVVAVKGNIDNITEAESQLNQNTNILDLILNYDINQ